MRGDNTGGRLSAMLTNRYILYHRKTLNNIFASNHHQSAAADKGGEPIKPEPAQNWSLLSAAGG